MPSEARQNQTPPFTEGLPYYDEPRPSRRPSKRRVQESLREYTDDQLLREQYQIKIMDAVRTHDKAAEVTARAAVFAINAVINPVPLDRTKAV